MARPPKRPNADRWLIGRDLQQRLAAKEALKRPPVVLTGVQARAVGHGFGSYVKKSGLAIWVCAILPDHVHLVVSRPPMKIEQCVIQLKGAATEALIEEKLHPFQGMVDHRGRTPKCFAQGQWKVYLDHADVPRANRYVENNPLKEGKPMQNWLFVIPYAGSRSAPLRRLRVAAKPPKPRRG